MRVLVIAYYFPPTGGGGVNRTLKLVRGLAERGAAPLVLTTDAAAWVQDPALLEQVPRATALLRLPNPDWGRVAGALGGARSRSAAPGRPGRLRRWLVPDLHVGWSAIAAPAAALCAATRAVDVVYTTCPPYSAHAAGLAARALGVPWVADFRDAWTECPTRVDWPAWRLRLERRMEEISLRRADRVLFASDAARDRALRRVPGLRERSRTVLTGFDERDFALGDGIRPPRDRFELVHAGSVLVNHMGETLERLLDALRAWETREPRVRETVRVGFVGGEPVLAGRFARAGLSEWVRVEPALSRAQLPDRLRQAHACLALASPAPFGADPIPGKLFDAVGAERPLLALTRPGALAALVRARGLGRVLEPGDRDGIVAALESLRRRALRGGRIAGPPEASRRALSSERAVAAIVGALEGAAALHREGASRCRSASAW